MENCESCIYKNLCASPEAPTVPPCEMEDADDESPGAADPGGNGSAQRTPGERAVKGGL